MNYKTSTTTGMQVYMYLFNPAGTQIQAVNQWKSGTGLAEWPSVTTPVSNTPGVGKIRANYFSTGYGTLGVDTVNVTFVAPPTWIESAPTTVSASGGNINVSVSYAAPSGSTGMNLKLEALSTTGAVIKSASDWVGNNGTLNFNSFAIPATTAGTGQLKASYFASGWGLIGTHTVNISYTSPMIRSNNGNLLSDGSAPLMYPNPANDFIYVDGSLAGTPGLQVEIVNISGQVVVGGSLSNLLDADQRLSLEHLKSGLYFATLRDEVGNKIIQHRFIKQ
ncbi:MAG: hypothetical protein DDT42_01827 [candidate division WS2 bacterium]|uniref:Secretion system C-terminal sorting domain-containing protein n=1 Tax=Psychracetigena formicireducens TaxID=2986056 RepID=A0A9E2F1Y1_PSYF1|nr:hypothetical protein [Candidatus Psychracetigena formicireducens]